MSECNKSNCSCPDYTQQPFFTCFVDLKNPINNIQTDFTSNIINSYERVYNFNIQDINTNVYSSKMIIKEDYCGTETNPMVKYEIEIEVFDKLTHKNAGYLLLKDFINSTLVNGVNTLPEGEINVNIEIGKGLFKNTNKIIWINQTDSWTFYVYNIPLCYQTLNTYTADTCAAVVSNCVDFRFIDPVVNQMNCAGLNNNYDNIAIPGVSVFINYEGTDPTLLSYKDTYTKYFETSLVLADVLHAVKSLVIVEHLDCGAYKAVYGDEEYYNNAIPLHKENIKKLAKFVLTNYSYYINRVFGYILTGNGDLIAVDIPNKI